MRLALVISTLGPGGAERVLTIMASYWATHGHDVTLITLSSEEEDFYHFHPALRRVGLNLIGPSRNLLTTCTNSIRRITGLREVIRDLCPHVVLSFIESTNILVVMAMLGIDLPVIVCERIDPRYHHIGCARTVLRSLLYRRTAALVVQTEGLRTWAEVLVPKRSVYVIPNPVSTLSYEPKNCSKGFGSRKIVSAMGRLVPQKGFDILLRAFGRCFLTHPDWSLVIIGEGPERACLEALANELEIQPRVSMVGKLSDPFPLLRGSDIFVLSSRYEGFPNALVEAMACGIPAVGTDCPSGPRDIIRHGVDGLLVPPNDVEALAQAMAHLMDNPAELQRLAQRAPEVIERFNTETIMKQWDDLLVHVVTSPIYDVQAVGNIA